METLKRKVGRPRKNETTTLRNFENEILMTKEKIKELENKYYQSETSFNSRFLRRTLKNSLKVKSLLENIGTMRISLF